MIGHNTEDEMKHFRNRPRDEYDRDLLYWAGSEDKNDYDRLVVRLLLEAVLDMREQNERIITLLQHPRTPTRMDIEIMKYIQDPTDMAYAELMEKLTKAGQPHA